MMIKRYPLSMKSNILCAIAFVFLVYTQFGTLGLSARSPAPDGPALRLSTINDTRLREAADNITSFHAELEPRLWSGANLVPKVRQRAEALALTIADQLDLPGVVVDDIVTIGSLASYEYDRDADFDVHIFVKAEGYAGDLEVLRKYIAQFNRANAEKYKGVTFYGYPVEFLVYLDAPSSQIQPGVSMYSIRSTTWLNPPVQNANNFDKQKILADSRIFIDRYNVVIGEFNKGAAGFDCTRIRSLGTDMRSYRRQGITTHGIRSTENLTYRMLRRLDINLLTSLRQADAECAALNASIYPD